MPKKRLIVTNGQRSARSSERTTSTSNVKMVTSNKIMVAGRDRVTTIKVTITEKITMNIREVGEKDKKIIDKD